MSDALEVDGLAQMRADIDALIEALANFPEIAAGETAQAVEKSLLLLQGGIAVYPPAEANSTYRRTGTLGRRWASAGRVVEMGEGSGAFVSGRVGNNTVYGPWVQDREQQADAHRGRWKTTADVLQENAEAVDAILEEAGVVMVQKVAEDAKR